MIELSAIWSKLYRRTHLAKPLIRKIMDTRMDSFSSGATLSPPLPEPSPLTRTPISEARTLIGLIYRLSEHPSRSIYFNLHPYHQPSARHLSNAPFDSCGNAVNLIFTMFDLNHQKLRFELLACERQICKEPRLLSQRRQRKDVAPTSIQSHVSDMSSTNAKPNIGCTKMISETTCCYYWGNSLLMPGKMQ